MKYTYLNIATLVLIGSHAHACTGLFLKHKNDGYTYARTLEFGQDLKSHILFIPKNYAIEAPSPNNAKGGLVWNTKYAAVGTNAFGLTCFVDGVNEKGLAGGLFYFPGFAEYQTIEPIHYKKSLPMWQLLTWILTTCASIQEVKQSITAIFISKAPLPGTSEIIPAHLIVHDATGNSVVIECVKGAVTIHDNPLGIITNSPTFDWHMTNLRNYVNLSPTNSREKIIAGVTFAPVSQGSGMFGMPGDFSSPSRFVRIAAFTQAAPMVENEIAGINQAFHMLNNFDIPKGCVRDQEGNVEFTLWTSAIDMKNKIFYCKPYDSFAPRKIELMKMDFKSKTVQTFPLNFTDTILPITA